MGLSDAATASDALDSDLQEQLGPAPDQPDSAPAPRARAAKSAPKGGRKPPHASELVKPLQGSLGLVTLLLGLLLCGFNLEDPLVDVVTMDADEAHAVAEPLANILARQKWFAQYGRHLVNSDDGIALAYALILYSSRVVPAVRERMGTRPRRERRQQQVAGIPAQPANPASNGYGPSGYAGLSGAYTAD